MLRHLGTPTSPDGLTKREEDVLALAAHGRTNREIASQLEISRNAVRYHLKEIHSKLETGGDRGLLLWRRIIGWPTLTAARFGDAAALTAITLITLGLTAGAVLTYRAVEGAATAQAEETQLLHSWPGATLRSFEVPGRISLETLQRLNPRFGDGPLPVDAEVVVPVLPGTRKIVIEPTPDASPGSQSRGGTPTR